MVARSLPKMFIHAYGVGATGATGGDIDRAVRRHREGPQPACTTRNGWRTPAIAAVTWIVLLMLHLWWFGAAPVAL
jgi:hypothetical protein